MPLLVRLSLFICGFIGAALFCKKQTDGFRIDKITSHLTYHSEWAVNLPETDKIQECLNQPFRYLGKGAQTFVFASEDGKYVIKFFRYDHMGDETFIRYLPFERFQLRVAKLKQKLEQDFTSYKIAYDNLKEETGLVYIHLNKTPSLLQKIHLVDKLGISHFLDLDDLEFVVQKRASLLVPTLQEMIRNGQDEAAKSVITQLISYLKTRCDKEIFDKDPDLFTNFGVIEGKVIQIDVGRFKYKTSDNKKEEIIRITDKLHHLLQEKSPLLDKELQRCIYEIPD